MNNSINLTRTEDSQKTASFTGEGAYHGSSNKEPEQTPVLAERIEFVKYKAYFNNHCDVKKILPVPSQEEIKDDGVTFVWCPFDDAKKEAGPLTQKVLLEMEPYLLRDKKFIYVDSKIQFFHKGDLPVDSKLWHVDGTSVIRGQHAYDMGYTLLHNMRDKEFSGIMDRYLAYQSSTHCATEWATNVVSVIIPELIPSFDLLDERVKEAKPRIMAQPAASIVAFTDNSLHRAVPATEDGWRLWIRVLETDKEVKLNRNIIECYNTVFRTT
jgi:hypothetical protein